MQPCELTRILDNSKSPRCRGFLKSRGVEIYDRPTIGAQEMKRHTRLSVTIGFLKLHCAVKEGMPMQYWYYIKLGSRWYPFDVRTVAKAAGHELPMIDNTDAQENLYNVAKWCRAINAQDYIKCSK